MAVGGAEGRDENQTILRRFADLAGGKRASILIVPTASENPDDAVRRYREVFRDIGVADIEALNVTSRDDANADCIIDTLGKATGVYISGGDQVRLVDLLVGTRVMEGLRQRSAEGAVVAGTSAGASILADHLLVGGGGIASDSNDASARRSLVELSAGFGLIRDAVIDQHFSARGRFGRLLSAFAALPGLVGLGIDEATAAIVSSDGELEVIGHGSVTVLDGRATMSDYFDRRAGELLSLADVSLHVLAPGRRFSLRAHRPQPFEETGYLGPLSEELLIQSINESLN
jgi:cyanophycinase